ncbi:hypothetical protein GGI15_001865 [Coemansia interrupta]|uniref:Uncharacterized protein n=1 Tax=Coemansia interrupta TaxID=1126814 RepID=A0A9W8HL66_9FUNG|nr:hypothetical protein GGI15_001865 [Coemansia interrupta]
MLLRQLAAVHTRALFLRRLPAVSHTHISIQAQRYSSSSVDIDKEIEAITDLATTAKDEMDFAEESRNSVYYNDDKRTAHEAVDEMTNTYNSLLDRLSESDRKAVETRIGIKIKEIQSAYEIMTLNDLED